MDDALISVFDAKYHYNFWRPVTAIRNADRDGNNATERDSSWTSFIEAPMHPEYPAGHAILAGAVAAVLKADIGHGATPLLATSSPTAKGATRRWTSVDAFVREVMNARVYEGVHYRFSTETGAAMGARIGALAAARLLQAPRVVGLRPLRAGHRASITAPRLPTGREPAPPAGCAPRAACALLDDSEPSYPQPERDG